MTSLRPWLLPTLTGPFLTTWGITAVLLLLTGQATVLGHRLDTWSLAMLLASAFAAGLVVMLITADVVLLRARMRRIPTGGDAWLSSLLCPMIMWGLWLVPVPVHSLFTAIVWLAATIAGAAFLSRLAFGTKL